MPGSRTAAPLPTWSPASSNGLVVDIGGTKLIVAAVSRGVIAEKRSFQVSGFAGPADMMDAIAQSGRRLCLDAQVPLDSAVVAVAGRLDRRAGTVVQAANLPFIDYPLASELSQRLGGASVRIEHDAACGLIGETLRGAARGMSNVIYLTVSTGVSVGILVDGAMLDGAHGVAGELGHAPVARPGAACPCGSTGCLEAYASGRGFAELGTRAAAEGRSPALAEVVATRGEVTAMDVLAAAEQSDEASVAIVDDAVALLASTIQLLLMTLDPEVVVLGGGVMSNLPFADRIIEASRLRGDAADRVRNARLGASSVLYGAIPFLGVNGRARQTSPTGHAAIGARLEALSAEKGAG